MAAIAAHVRPGGRDHYQLLGVADGQQPENELVHQGEDRGIGSDAERQRGDGDQGEKRAAAKVAQGKA